MILGFISALIVGGLTGWASERLGLTRMGVMAAVIIAVGGAVIASLVSSMFGLVFYGRTATAVLGAALALAIVPRAIRR
ncbi:MAG: hypothetical protein AAGE18_09705 [Pseudomonadota bacterium]